MPLQNTLQQDTKHLRTNHSIIKSALLVLPSQIYWPDKAYTYRGVCPFRWRPATRPAGGVYSSPSKDDIAFPPWNDSPLVIDLLFAAGKDPSRQCSTNTRNKWAFFLMFSTYSSSGPPSQVTGESVRSLIPPPPPGGNKVGGIQRYSALPAPTPLQLGCVRSQTTLILSSKDTQSTKIYFISHRKRGEVLVETSTGGVKLCDLASTCGIPQSELPTPLSNVKKPVCRVSVE